jgi:hypothetical protein
MFLCRTCNTGYGLRHDRLLNEVPVEIFEEWRTLYAIEPWAEERTDLAAGIGIAYSAACHGAEPKPPREYMPYLKRAVEKKQSPADIQRAWDTVCDVMERAERDRERG